LFLCLQPPVSSLFFFSSCYGAHRDLHSFPTRRSSDLSNALYVAYNAARAFVSQDESRSVPVHLRNAPTRLMKELGYGHAYRYARSEEHTSELQSRENLVCRLLLEKKNKANIGHLCRDR